VRTNKTKSRQGRQRTLSAPMYAHPASRDQSAVHPSFPTHLLKSHFGRQSVHHNRRTLCGDSTCPVR
jgi:hypothetical protein